VISGAEALRISASSFGHVQSTLPLSSLICLASTPLIAGAEQQKKNLMS
jgi:hypothetical protein